MRSRSDSIRRDLAAIAEQPVLRGAVHRTRL